ncbi:MAG TPA: hypothetical protein DCX25_02670 [Candidatus Pacebacteria bacterium]|nr:MAG: hypothetical protein UX00_C0004G0042 [Microgenomates group bacterium GW2011_GWB1_45_17]KKU23960.1 MAG: hypothetical protein UX35_C0003G0096 [Microgenomates group bacterium GW2011_GWA1_46_15]KKU24647.1 MAG: hypothetical protein UX36_C0001G0264 [Microgenomates group bacterium GW2011_GWC1_46_15]HAV15208.1 hypothetical protein [Candidatus Paceibacterota bacterium]HCR11082.1 hypothetical protein [Candidatus Paceibacterota bacterium]
MDKRKKRRTGEIEPMLYFLNKGNSLQKAIAEGRVTPGLIVGIQRLSNIDGEFVVVTNPELYTQVYQDVKRRGSMAHAISIGMFDLEKEYGLILVDPTDLIGERSTELRSIVHALNVLNPLETDDPRSSRRR